jgi:AcrR family transcriptional regulator
MSSRSRHRILDAALAMLREGGTVSLESAAHRAGLTKPGLMYHFPTKEALMIALVDHVVDGWERELATRLGEPVATAPPAERCRAYLEWSLSGEFDQGDLVIFTDPRLCGPMTARWAERLGPWLELPGELTPDQRARFTAVRLLADGAWFADAIDVFPLTADERGRIVDIADSLLKG